jgi:hypothetical protein
MAKSGKLPAMQWYPGDWRKDVGVQSLSYHDRGVWFEILNLMHESECRGILLLNEIAMPDEALARLLGLDNQTLAITLSNLLTSGVASRDDETGALMNRRMVRDEELRLIRTEVGKTGGNPILLKQKRTTIVKQIPTPSSSSSTSSSDTTTPVSTSSQADAPELQTGEKDPRHAPIRELIQRLHFEKFKIQAEWNGSEAKALNRLLSANPHWTMNQISAMVRNRFDSESIPSERPRKWLPDLSAYAAGPLDRFGRLQGFRPKRRDTDAAVGTRPGYSEPQDLAPSIELPGDLDRGAGVAVWKRVQGALGREMNPHQFDTWIKPTHGEGVHGDTLYVRVPTSEFEFIGERFEREIRGALPDHIATVKFFHLLPMSPSKPRQQTTDPSVMDIKVSAFRFSEQTERNLSKSEQSR